MTEKIGPVQLVAIGFAPEAKFEGRVMDELSRLERHETIRILDLLFVHKDAQTGDLLALDYQGEELAASLDPGSSAGFLLIEHVWARNLKRAIRDAGGFPLGEGFLTPEAIAAVAAELVAMSEAHDELESEEAGV